MRPGRSIILWILVIIVTACTTSPPSLAVFEEAVVPTRQPTPEPVTALVDASATDVITGTGAVFPVIEGGPIEIGDTVNSAIFEDAYAHIYTFAGQPGQSIDISMAGRGTMDTYLILIGTDGREIARNDDRPENSDAAMLGVTLPEGGQYTVVATRWRQRYGVDAGDFTLTVRESNSAERSLNFTQLTSYGVPQSGTITNEKWFDAYTFAGTAGDQIDITLINAGDDTSLDGSLLLTDSVGNEIVFSQDQNPLNNVDPAIYDFVLPYTGYYTVIATRDDYGRGTSTGNYEMLIERIESGIEVTPRAYPDPNQTLTLLTDERGFWTYGLFVGDVLDSNFGEVGTQSILTFYFPPLESELTSASLDLTACDTGGAGFEAIESINVYAEQLEDRINALTPFQPTSTARLLVWLGACDVVDITAVARELYEDGNGGRLQFRLIPQSTLTNDTRDAVTFLSPRITLQTD